MPCSETWKRSFRDLAGETEYPSMEGFDGYSVNVFGEDWVRT